MRNKFLFLFLLPLFYAWHGYVENYRLVSRKGMLMLTVTYCLLSLCLYGIFLLVYREKNRAAAGTLILLLIFFFFGSLQDALAIYIPGSFINRYSILLPVLAILAILLLLVVRKRNLLPGKLILYLNCLFLVLILADTGRLFFKAKKYREQVLLTHPPAWQRCDSCEKPDIFLVLADEYAGRESLDSFFHFDNSGFEEQLASRGFYLVRDAHSNYNSTPFSMASLLNLSYLDGLRGSHRNRKDLNRCYHALEENRLTGFLQQNGYVFHNYSPFDIAGQTSLAEENFLPKNTSWISGNTLYGRIRRDLGYHWLRLTGGKKAMRRFNEKEEKNNERAERQLLELLHAESPLPRFVYTHLMLPHYPYYTDHQGRPYPADDLQDHYNDKERYIEYLQYANGRLLSLVDSILHYSFRPVIVLMGDHGFRQWDSPPSLSVLYNNLNAVLLPGRDYSRFYNGMSNVNAFRVIVNSVFGQQLPLLRDSTVFISDKRIE